MISKRLKFIGDLVTTKSIIDIGSDHGYLPLYLLNNNKIISATVIEINNDPLINAKKTLKYTDNVEFYLSNGLQEYQEVIDKDATVIIAGMGGSLIRDIISQDREKLRICSIIAQPNNKEERLREYLYKNDFYIQTEHTVIDAEKYYTVIEIRNGSKHISKEETILGVNPVEDENYAAYMKELKEHYLSIVNSLKDNDKTNEVIENFYSIISDYLGE